MPEYEATVKSPQGDQRIRFVEPDKRAAEELSTTDPLLCYFDLGAQSVTAATLTVQFDATGIAKIDVT